MKKILYIILAIVLVSACAGNKEAKELFARVESVMDEYPDSALALLERAKTHKDAWSKAQRMRFELLHAKAQNKAYVDFTTDSVMKEVVEYYDGHGTANEKMEAHYLLGCTYRDMGESPMALSCYLDATEKADTLSEDCDYGALMRIWGQIADEYNRQAMPYKQIEASHKFEKLALQLKDTFNYAIGIHRECDAYILVSDTNNILKLSEKAAMLYKKLGLKDRYIYVYSTLLPIYINQNQLRKAESIIDAFENTTSFFSNNGEIKAGDEIYYRAKALYYEKKNQLDSAKYYYRKLQHYDKNIESYVGLLRLYELQGITDSICKYSRLYDESLAKVYTKFHTQAMFNAEGMFNYSRNQRIALQKTHETELMESYVVIVVLLVLLVVFIGVRTFLVFKSKKMQEIHLLNKKYESAESKYQKAMEDYCLMETDFNAYKAKKEVELSIISSQSFKNEERYKKIKGECDFILSDYKAYKKEKEEEIVLLKKRRDESARIYEKTHINELLLEITNSNLVSFLSIDNKIVPGINLRIRKKDWNTLRNLFKQKIPFFYSTIVAKAGLSDKEQQILLLTVLNIQSKSISILLDMSYSHVSNIKANVNTKLFQDASAKTLRKNIMTHYLAT